MTPLLLSKRRAAALLGISRNHTLNELIAAGHLRVVKLGGSRIRIPLEDVQRLAREGIEPARPAPAKRAPKKASKLAPWEQVLAIQL